MKAKSKLGQEWSAAEVRSMRRLAAKGLSARQFAERTGRSRGAVAYKAMVERVHFRSIKQPRGVQKRRFARAAAIARPRRRAK